jgi:hypothetical protein
MPHGIANPLPEVHLLTNRKALGLTIPPKLLFTADEVIAYDFRLWPKADIRIVWANVRFRGNSGHHVFTTSYPVLTQLGSGVCITAVEDDCLASHSITLSA